jgi:exosortase B
MRLRPPAISPAGAPAAGKPSIPGFWTAQPILLGLLALYGPTYSTLFSGLWQDPEQAHAPLVALVVAMLFWRLRQPMSALSPSSSGLSGTTILGLGLLLALLGTAMASPFLIMLSQIPVLAGVFVMLWGTQGLRLAWFPLAFLAFMLPLPGIVIDALTGQLKEWISLLTEELLYGLGYPVARNGVVITIGQYRLLVADACSGLHSIVSLSALGSLFIYLMGRNNHLHNLLMVACILPIAFTANLVRVLLLALLTFHLGDATGRVVHDLAGITVFLTALGLLFGIDALLARVLHPTGQARS